MNIPSYIIHIPHPGRGYNVCANIGRKTLHSYEFGETIYTRGHLGFVVKNLINLLWGSSRRGRSLFSHCEYLK